MPGLTGEQLLLHDETTRQLSIYQGFGVMSGFGVRQTLAYSRNNKTAKRFA